MKEVFKKADNSEGIDVDGENLTLTNLWFADDVALFNEKNPHQNKNKTTKKQQPQNKWKKHQNSLNSKT